MLLACRGEDKGATYDIVQEVLRDEKNVTYLYAPWIFLLQ